MVHTLHLNCKFTMYSMDNGLTESLATFLQCWTGRDFMQKSKSRWHWAWALHLKSQSRAWLSTVMDDQINVACHFARPWAMNAVTKWLGDRNVPTLRFHQSQMLWQSTKVLQMRFSIIIINRGPCVCKKRSHLSLVDYGNTSSSSVNEHQPQSWPLLSF